MTEKMAERGPECLDGRRGDDLTPSQSRVASGVSSAGHPGGTPDRAGDPALRVAGAGAGAGYPEAVLTLVDLLVPRIPI